MPARSSKAALCGEESCSRYLAAIEEASLDWPKLAEPLLSEDRGREPLTAAQAATHQGRLGNNALVLGESPGYVD